MKINVFLLGDFNIDLLKYDKHAPTNEFLDSLSSHMFLPHIVQPSRISVTFKTLIDNIFSNIHTSSSISCHLTSVLDHHPQFLIVPDVFLNSSPLKSNIYERDWNNFGQENFILDYLICLWIRLLLLNQKRKTKIFHLNVFWRNSIKFLISSIKKAN